MNVKTLLVTSSAALLLLATPPVVADAQLHFVAPNNSGGKGTANAEAATSVYVASNIVRIEDASEPRMYSLYDVKTGNLTVVDRSQKSYMVMDSTTLASIETEIDRMRELAKEQLKTLPPAQRQQLEAMMGIGLKDAPKVQVKDANKSREIVGVKCNDKQLVSDGTIKHIYCIADTMALGIQPADFNAIAALLTAMQKLAERTGAGTAIVPLDPQTLGGLPVRMENIGSKIRPLVELAKIEQKTLAAEVFLVPEGYKRETPTF